MGESRCVNVTGNCVVWMESHCVNVTGSCIAWGSLVVLGLARNQ